MLHSERCIGKGILHSVGASLVAFSTFIKRAYMTEVHLSSLLDVGS